MLTTQLVDGAKLRSTISHAEFPLEQVQEFTDGGESLEVVLPNILTAQIRKGQHLWERFVDFLPFRQMDPMVSLGEGNTPLLRASQPLQDFTGIKNLLLKDETQNPTWSFKDRGSLTSIFLAQAMGESVTATISTGNMGNSIAAYAARSGLRSIVFIPHFAPEQKVQAMSIHGATVIRVTAPDYAHMKSTILDLAAELDLRIVSGNGPVRVEGYKLVAFELFEQLEGKVPDYIAVPTSACGHLRGIWKGWRELMEAGLVNRLPKMIVVQAENNSPIVSALRVGTRQIIPFKDFDTVAEAITSGNPLGGDELLHKSYQYGWLGEAATEEEILDGQRCLARAGHFVEPATATSLHALRKLRTAGKIDDGAIVIVMLTGAGLKDLDVMRNHPSVLHETSVTGLRQIVSTITRN